MLVQDHYRYEDQIVKHPQTEQNPIPLPNLPTLNALRGQPLLIEMLCLDENCLNQMLLIDLLLFEPELFVHQYLCRKVLVTLDRKGAFYLLEA
jgi:hypothetical protein